MNLTKEDMARLLLESGKELGLFSQKTLLVEVDEVLQLMFEKRLREEQENPKEEQRKTIKDYIFNLWRNKNYGN